MRRLALIGSLLGILACDGPDAPACDDLDELAPNVEVALAHASDWRETPADADPLVAHQAGTVACPASAWGEAFGVIELSTASCNYASLDQALAEDIALGDRLRLSLWWAPLYASEPALAHLALLVEGELLWETEVEIPGPADAREIEFDSPLRAEAGATLTFHLHNHGQNSWTLASLERLRSAERACP